MEHRGVLASLLIAASVLAGCSSAGPAAATSADGRASPSETDPLANVPTLVPGAVTAPPLDAGSLELTAFAIDFEPHRLVVPTGPLEVQFHNRDNAIPHGFTINNEAGGSVFEGEIAIGPADIAYSIPDLPAGSYTFMCPVHPNMTGTLTVVP